jgi:hypothetical protein
LASSTPSCFSSESRAAFFLVGKCIDSSFRRFPPNIREAWNQSRRLLETWLELLHALQIPVVVMFDQLEDFLRSADREEELINRRFFTNATALFVNELRNVCLIIFAERGF